MDLCRKPMASRSKYKIVAEKRCQREKGHGGSCAEFAYLDHLQEVQPSVAAKIRRDSTMTTGASWKSDDAGPNRILRWVMLLSDDELRAYGIDMSGLQPQVVAKLREKAADYDECMDVARRLTWLAYQMQGAPQPPKEVYMKFKRVENTLQFKVNGEKCNYPKCTLCMDNCPMKVIDLSVSPPVFPKRCQPCFFCEMICPEGAIEIDYEPHSRLEVKRARTIFVKVLDRAEAEGTFRR